MLGCEYKRDLNVDQISTLFDESGCQTVRADACVPVSPRLYEVDINGTEEKIGDGEDGDCEEYQSRFESHLVIRVVCVLQRGWFQTR